MRLTSICLLAALTAGCASPRPAAFPQPGVFERVADRLNKSPSGPNVPINRKWCAKNPGRCAEADAQRNPAERRGEVLVATRMSEVRREQLRKAEAQKTKSDEPTPNKYNPKDAGEDSGGKYGSQR